MEWDSGLRDIVHGIEKGKKGRHTRGGKVETGRDTVPKDRRPQGQKEEEEEERTVPPHQKVL
jgi:hypothetical protein